MADVSVDIKISVEDLDKLDQVAEKVKQTVRVASLTFEDIGFGIKLIRAKVLVDDKIEGFDSVEEKIKAIKYVSQVDVVSMDRGF